MFKKTFLRLIALVIVTALCVLSFAGCMFIQENKSRVANKDIITVRGANGITLTITQNEILDYYNSYAYYLVNYYGYTAEQVMDFAIESKIKNKYLVTVAMGYLVNDVANRKSVLYGEGRMEKPVDVLTFAEYFAAISTVNTTIEETIDGYIETDYQQSLTRIVSGVDKTNIDRIEFSESTLDYLKENYYVGQEIDTDKIKFVIIYDEDENGNVNVSDEMIVPTSMYTTAFTTEAASESSQIVISLEERIENSDNTISYETQEASYEYKVIEARATKNEVEEEDSDELSIGDIKVNRYATLQELNEKGAAIDMIDIEAKYNQLQSDPNANTLERDAYRQMNEALSRNYKTVKYLYETAFESAVISALQAEKEKEALKDNWDNEVLKQYKYYYNSAREGYKDGKDEDLAFAKSITSGLESYYYHPEVENLDQYFYVYQILFNFSEEQKNFLSNYTSADKESIKNEFYEFMTGEVETKVSNPKYDAEYKCPYHAAGDHDADCKWEEEKEANDESLCPSIAYLMNEDGTYVMHDFLTVYNELQTELLMASDAEAFKIFEEYMYIYNDDPGIMNSSAGYLIVPGDEDPNGFYQSFIDLAKSVAYSYDDEGNPYLDPKVGDAFVKDGDGIKLGYGFTDYGIHIIMVSMKPFDSNEELTFANDEAMLEYTKNKVINLNGDTIYDVLKKKAITEAKSLAYSDFTSSVVPNDLHEDKNIVTKDEKAIKKLYENYVG